MTRSDNTTPEAALQETAGIQETGGPEETAGTQDTGLQETPTSEMGTPSEKTLADRISEAVLAHPCVQRLHGGGSETGQLIATHLPGRRVLGVRVPETEGPVEVAVVLRLDRPLPAVVDELRSAVRTVIGEGAVDITVSDVVLCEQP